MIDDNRDIPQNEPPQMEHDAQSKQEFNARKRLRTIFVLGIFVLIMWLGMKFFVPSPFPNSPIKNTQISGTFESEALSTSALNSKPVIQEPPIADILSPLPDTPNESTVESQQSKTAPAAQVVNEPLTEDVRTEALDADATHAETVEAPADTAISQGDQGEAAIAVVQPEVDLHPETASKDKTIAELQCLIHLETQNIEQIKLALSSCYAVMVNAGVTQRDIYVLKRAAQEDYLVNNIELKKSFQESIRKSLLQKNNSENAQVGWYRTMKQKITGSFTVRKTGWQEGNSIEAVIARAEVFLEQEKVRAALSEVLTLPEKAQAPFATFSEHARALISLQRVKNVLKGDGAQLNEEDSYAH